MQMNKVIKPINKESSVDGTPTTWDNYSAVQTIYTFAVSRCRSCRLRYSQCTTGIPGHNESCRCPLAAAAVDLMLMLMYCGRVRFISDIKHRQSLVRSHGCTYSVTRRRRAAVPRTALTYVASPPRTYRYIPRVH